MKTTENDRLIAEFMGMEECDGSYYKKIYNSGDWIPQTELEFHTSWDWLMPVVQKCYKIDDEEGFDNLVDAVSTLDIDGTYNAVVDFINEYNINK